MKNIKNKKPLYLIGMLLAAAGVGFTVAYNSTSAPLSNRFEMAEYKVAYTEEFASPDNWKPCDETEKTFVVKNEGTAPVHVRIKYEEYWRNKVDSEYLQPVKDGVQLTEIIFQNESDWQLKSDGYYYYKEPLPAGEATNSLFKAVKLNCNANFGKENICTKTANGTVCEKPADEYEGAKYHLKITAETLQIGAGSFRDVMASQANPRDYYINFAKKAVVNDDVFVANGNGVNHYRENGVEVYYYRGEVANNNVIWADLCWKIIRSTATGGTKMIYNGEPTVVDGKKQCNATGSATMINGTTYRFNNSSLSPADIGYKFGARVEVAWFNPGSSVFVYSNDVSRNGNTYTLDTSEGQSISGVWLDTRDQAATRYHYFCTNGATTCDSSRIGYIQYYNDNWSYAGNIYYLNIGGYDNINQALDAMFVNTHDSVAKTTIETWFRNKHLDEREDDLEDAIYCNDRTYIHGAFVGKDANGIDESYEDWSSYNIHGSYNNSELFNSDGNIEPSLECPNVRDSFTKSTENGNGELTYKVGLITASESVLAGASNWQYDYADTHYAYNGQDTWSMSPAVYGAGYAGQYLLSSYVRSTGTYEPRGLRPVVSLKADVTFILGTGEKTDPYIVE